MMRMVELKLPPVVAEQLRSRRILTGSSEGGHSPMWPGDMGSSHKEMGGTEVRWLQQPPIEAAGQGNLLLACCGGQVRHLCTQDLWRILFLGAFGASLHPQRLGCPNVS